MTAPRPQGVRIVRRNGDVVPIELAYAGRDAEGLDVWRIATPCDLFGGDHIEVDVFPARCTIQGPVA